MLSSEVGLYLFFVQRVHLQVVGTCPPSRSHSVHLNYVIVYTTLYANADATPGWVLVWKILLFRESGSGKGRHHYKRVVFFRASPELAIHKTRHESCPWQNIFSGWLQNCQAGQSSGWCGCCASILGLLILARAKIASFIDLCSLVFVPYHNLPHILHIFSTVDDCQVSSETIFCASQGIKSSASDGFYLHQPLIPNPDFLFVFLECWQLCLPLSFQFIYVTLLRILEQFFY